MRPAAGTVRSPPKGNRSPRASFLRHRSLTLRLPPKRVRGRTHDGGRSAVTRKSSSHLAGRGKRRGRNEARRGLVGIRDVVESSVGLRGWINSVAAYFFREM